MAEKKKFLLRISPEIWAELESWAQAEFRSVNGQLEFEPYPFFTTSVAGALLLPGSAALVEDPAYEESIKYVREGRRVVVARTFSKIYGLAGLRIGYAICDEELASYLERARHPFNVNRLAEIGALAALDDEEHVRRTLETNARGIDYLCLSTEAPLDHALFRFLSQRARRRGQR